MDKRELAYVKQTIPAVKEWDDFQSLIRTWARLLRPDEIRRSLVWVKKI
ncbi:MAG: hypothetical protein ACWGOX_10500 [Desulforhopalus sp.]